MLPRSSVDRRTFVLNGGQRSRDNDESGDYCIACRITETLRADDIPDSRPHQTFFDWPSVVIGSSSNILIHLSRFPFDFLIYSCNRDRPG